MSSYHYPVGEQITEPAEARQDPGKRDRERGLIAEAAAFGWRTALDFGCGRGANFDAVYDAGADARRTLTGVDPDSSRVAEAQKLATANVRAIEGDVSTVENWSAEQRFDFILVCQVIGHTAVADAARILRALRARLAPGGKLIVLAPFATAAAVEAGAPETGDYFHLVDFSQPFDSRSFRRLLTPEAFDRAARAPETGLLPVRCFRIADSAWRRGDALPVAAPVPDAIAAELLGLQTRALIYSVHRETSQGRAAIGDLAIIAQA